MSKAALLNETISDAVKEYYGAAASQAYNPDHYTVEDLKGKLRKRKLAVKGRKAILIERLIADDTIRQANERLNIIQTYGHIQDWDMSKVTSMNPYIRIALTARLEQDSKLLNSYLFQQSLLQNNYHNYRFRR